MSATAIQVPTRQEIFEKEWESLFPKQVTDNYTSSITFVKQLTAVAISTITYMKNAFPEESYTNENFAGLQLKILKQKCADGLAQFVSASLKQAFEAFDKKYVHQLALCFYNGECVPENLIEYHIFEYSYNADGVSLNINSKNRNQNSKRFSMQAIHNRTVMMIRSLSLFITTNCHEQLPLNFDISMRIYYTEDTPEDYQAPGFAECTGPDPVLDTLHTAVCLGRVETPYNKIVARTFVQGVTDTDPEG
ncbi:HORMA domain-containing protein 2-like [Leguminivora glycinivorella]|uniref:HORMA domain-containing protein 2-like n=1 Tax=Leguminivora glycinivorella TaxID=1035111 RepID=UPI00200E2E4D|nr:HORMA domain-containing protein 2-like [Leguminivora glycinivorella]